jgi:hypothetical protein
MQKSAELNKLYGALQSCRNPGAAFQNFCAALLASMGFTSIFCRRGVEQGRDIDAEFGGFRWFFECKLVREDVDTPSFAYKFLQLDALNKNQRPDFFVLLSNGSIKSILNDIVRFKQTDRNTTYEVALWANHTSDNVFNDIVLSEITTALSFFQKILPNILSMEEKQRLQSIAQNQNSNRGRFIERLTLSPLFRKRVEPSATSELIKFVHDATMATVWNSDVANVLYTTLLVVGIPDRTAFGLLPCTSYRDRDELARAYRPWGMYPHNHQQQSSMLFDEHTLISRENTLMTEWGGVATLSEIPFADPVVPANGFFICIKEAAVRFRNYLKRGSLVTPCWLFVRVEEFAYTHMARLTGSKAPPINLRFRTLERSYQKNWTLEEARDDYIRSLPICAQPVRVLSPPNDYRELGLALAENIWSAVVGKHCDILKAVHSIHERLQKDYKHKDSVEMLGRLVEFRKGFDYLLDHDLFHRPYSNFDPSNK